MELYNKIQHHLFNSKAKGSLLILGIIMSLLMAPVLFSDFNNHFAEAEVSENLFPQASQNCVVKEESINQPQLIETEKPNTSHYNFLASYFMHESRSGKRSNTETSSKSFGTTLISIHKLFWQK